MGGQLKYLSESMRDSQEFRRTELDQQLPLFQQRIMPLSGHKRMTVEMLQEPGVVGCGQIAAQAVALTVAPGARR